MFLLASCATAPPPGDLASGDDNWSLAGKLGIRSPDFNGGLSVDWSTNAGDFDIRLSGPLGVSVARIESAFDGVYLTSPDVPRQFVPLSRLSNYLGYPLPLEHLMYWVRGGPAPGHLYEADDARGFEQAGWRVAFPGLESEGDSEPRRVRISRKDTTLTLLIRKWRY